MAMRYCLHLFLIFVLGGCATFSSDGTASSDASETSPAHRDRVRERELQTTWRGKPYTALVEAYGAPNMIMNVPGFRPLKTSVAVYGVRDAKSRCIDAFTVVKHGVTGEWTVADYFCR